MTRVEQMTLFSIYGVSIKHPADWRIFFDPKRPFHWDTGFFRIEDYVPRKGAQLSLSLNWEKAPGDNETFARQYCENIAGQYQKQLKKTPHRVERMEVVDYLEGKAAFIVSEYLGSPGLMKKKTDEVVRVLQLAFYDEDSGRAVVSSVMGRVERLCEQEALLTELIFSTRCGRSDDLRRSVY